MSADQVHLIDRPQAENDGRWSVACSCGWRTCGLQVHVDRAVARHRARVAELLPVTAYVSAITHKARGGRYAEPVPTQHAADPARPPVGGSYLALCGGRVQHRGSSPFNPDHPKACRACKELVQGG